MWGDTPIQVQDDLRSLRTAALREVGESGRAGEVDAQALDSLLTRTEQTMQLLAEKVMDSSQNEVATLPAVAHTSRPSHKDHLQRAETYRSRLRRRCVLLYEVRLSWKVLIRPWLYHF